MENEKRLIGAGDILYIIGKYSFSGNENPEVIEVQVDSKYRKRYYASPTKRVGTFCFAQSDFGKTVFYNREDAECVLRRYLDAPDRCQ